MQFPNRVARKFVSTVRKSGYWKSSEINFRGHRIKRRGKSLNCAINRIACFGVLIKLPSLYRRPLSRSPQISSSNLRGNSTLTTIFISTIKSFSRRKQSSNFFANAEEEREREREGEERERPALPSVIFLRQFIFILVRSLASKIRAAYLPTWFTARNKNQRKLMKLSRINIDQMFSHRGLNNFEKWN